MADRRYFWTPPAFDTSIPQPRIQVPRPSPRFLPTSPIRRQFTLELPPIVPMFGPQRFIFRRNQAPSPVHYLPKVKLFLDVPEPNSQICAICHEPFSMLAIVTDLSCGHLMHHNCLCDWICRHNSCPICRENVTPRFFPPITTTT